MEFGLNVTYLRWQVHSSYMTSHCRTRAEQTLTDMPMEPGGIPDHLCAIPDNVIAVHEDSHCRPVYQQQWPSVRDGNTPELCIPTGHFFAGRKPTGIESFDNVGWQTLNFKNISVMQSG